MAIFDFLRRSPVVQDGYGPRSDFGQGAIAYSLEDPRLVDFLRSGMDTVTGSPLSIATALRNPSMFRAVSLISNSIGMLPLHLINKETKEKAKDHPVYKIMHRRPNSWQTAYDFRSLMQLRALVKGDAYALIIRTTNVSTGRRQISSLVPIDPDLIEPKMSADWVVSYQHNPQSGGSRIIPATDIFHLRGLSLDGLRGISLVKQARDAIAIALAAEMAAGRLFKNGVIGGAALKTAGKLSVAAYDRLKQSLSEREGAENAGKTMIFEEGLAWDVFEKSARDSQLSELRKLQVEEIARITGVPRPLLMVDETSWGSGIEALGQFFVGYGLNPWFEAWQQGVERSLLDDDEQDSYEAKFNPGALLRGSLKDQAEFLSKALGAGGTSPWMHVDEVRDVMDLPKREDPPNTMMGHNGGPALEKDAKK